MGFFERLFGKKTDEPPPPLSGDGEDQGASGGHASGVPPLALGDAAAKGAAPNGKKVLTQAQVPTDPRAPRPDAKGADPKAAAQAKAPDPKAPDPKAQAAKAAPAAASPAQAKPGAAPDAKAQDAKAQGAKPATAQSATAPAQSATAQSATAPAQSATAQSATAPAKSSAAPQKEAVPPPKEAAPAAKPPASPAPAAAQAKAAPPAAQKPASPPQPAASTTSSSPPPAVKTGAAQKPLPSAPKPGVAPPVAEIQARPAPAGAPQQKAGQPASKDLVDELISALDGTFVEAAGPAASTAGTLEVDRAQVEGLFAEIAAQYARPVKEFIVELRRGSATRDWIDVCRPALSSIAKAAKSMNLDSAVAVMDEFDGALKASSGAPGKDPKLNTTEQKALLDRYDKMVEILPKAFSITEELRRRDGIIINALLKQIPEVGRVTLDKLYAAGLTSMDVLLLAKKDELAVASGVGTRIAEQICQKLREYQEQSSGTKRVDMKAYRKRLTELLGMLKTTHAAFVKADGDPGATDEKRRLRGARQNLVFQISIVLAELGEAEFVKECDKLTFERRIQALDEFLARSAQRM